MSWPKEKSFNRYPSDLTDAEWEIIQPILEEWKSNRRGRPRTVDLREILNAIFYLNKTGCQWRYLPKDFPPYTAVSYYSFPLQIIELIKKQLVQFIILKMKLS